VRLTYGFDGNGTLDLLVFEPGTCVPDSQASSLSLSLVNPAQQCGAASLQECPFLSGCEEISLYTCSPANVSNPCTALGDQCFQSPNCTSQFFCTGLNPAFCGGGSSSQSQCLGLYDSQTNSSCSWIGSCVPDCNGKIVTECTGFCQFSASPQCVTANCSALSPSECSSSFGCSNGGDSCGPALNRYNFSIPCPFSADPSLCSSFAVCDPTREFLLLLLILFCLFFILFYFLFIYFNMITPLPIYSCAIRSSGMSRSGGRVLLRLRVFR